MSQNSDVPAPYSLLAEITHRCPLHCVYCSNPLELSAPQTELATEDWLRVLEQAQALGVVQVHFSGGEPLDRADLEQMVRRARALGVYTNLITSGLGLTRPRARALADDGLDSVQLSVQDAEAVLSDSMAGRKAFAAKQQAAEAAREAGLPLSMNVVLHRLNLERVEEIIDLCLSWGAERLELANAQYYGWALVNLERLLPSREQLEKAEAVYQRKKGSLRGKMELIWVRSDYYEPFPKPCMGGWGRIHLTVSPDGFVLPCPVAKTIKTLRFDSVQERSLSWIWYQSPAFNRFRGWDWMPEPCRSCSRRFEDFGGCRCQAFALAGDAAKTDPVCQWAPDHALVEAAVARGSEAHRANPSKPRESKETFRGLVYRHLRAS